MCPFVQICQDDAEPKGSVDICGDNYTVRYVHLSPAASSANASQQGGAASVTGPAVRRRFCEWTTRRNERTPCFNVDT